MVRTAAERIRKVKARVARKKKAQWVEDRKRLMYPLPVKFPAATFVALEKESIRLDRSVAFLIREIVGRYLEVPKEKRHGVRGRKDSSISAHAQAELVSDRDEIIDRGDAAD